MKPCFLMPTPQAGYCFSSIIVARMLLMVIHVHCKFGTVKVILYGLRAIG